MEVEHFVNDSEQLNIFYGSTTKNIVADSFLWDERELISLEPVLNRINMFGERFHIYLFMSEICSYPLNFKNRFFGFWNFYEKQYHLNFLNKIEKAVELEQFVLRFGIGEISKSQLGIALEVFQKKSWNSFILLSNSEPNNLPNIDNILKFDKQKSKYYTDYAFMLNSLNRDILITTRNGCGGISINFFYSQNSN